MLQIQIDELDDQVFDCTEEEEEGVLYLQLDRWGAVSLETVDLCPTWGMDHAEAHHVVIRWELPLDLTAPSFLQLLATLWTQLEKVHRGHTVVGQHADAEGKLDMLSGWAADAVTCLIGDYTQAARKAALVSVF